LILSCFSETYPIKVFAASSFCRNSTTFLYFKCSSIESFSPSNFDNIFCDWNFFLKFFYPTISCSGFVKIAFSCIYNFFNHFIVNHDESDLSDLSNPFNHFPTYFRRDRFLKHKHINFPLLQSQFLTSQQQHSFNVKSFFSSLF